MKDNNRLNAGKGYSNKDMNPETYLKRKKVMDCIYYANDLLRKNGMNLLPRIDIRICDTNEDARNSLGRARLNDNILWIPERTLKMSNDDIKLTVFHEIVHACFGLEHDDNCPIMCTYHKSISSNQRDNTFLKICEENKHRLQNQENRKSKRRNRP